MRLVAHYLCYSTFNPDFSTYDDFISNAIKSKHHVLYILWVLVDLTLCCCWFPSLHISGVQAGMKAGVWIVISCHHLTFLDLKLLGCDRFLWDLLGVRYSVKHTWGNVSGLKFSAYILHIFHLIQTLSTLLGSVGSALAPSSSRTVRWFPPITAAWRAVEPFWRQQNEMWDMYFPVTNKY